ncbi:MAG: hypothetical protein AAB413_04260 [Patescibacteria group bacterium]
MKRLALFFLLFALVLLPRASFAYNSNICKNTSGCTEVEVGPFMQGISQGCGNLGDCTLDDILTVFVNIGNYVVGIIGAVVLLMYIAGGFYWLASAGRKEWVDKGKKYMTISTVGLLIVMFSYLGIYALKGSLQYGNAYMSDTQQYVACTGVDTYGLPCDLNSTCTVNGCESACRQNNPNFTTAEDGIFTVITYKDCVDTGEDGMGTSDSESNPWYTSGSCQSNLCFGGDEVLCCEVHYFY